MKETPNLNPAGVVARAAEDLDAQLRSLRRKLERAARRGEPTERLEARVRGVEEQLRRLRAYDPARFEKWRQA